MEVGGISHEDALAIASTLEEDEKLRLARSAAGGRSDGGDVIALDDDGPREEAWRPSRATASAAAAPRKTSGREVIDRDLMLANGADDDDEDGEDGMVPEMLLPSDLSTLDAEVLSTLPQSLQLEILEKMRDAQVQGEGRTHVQGLFCQNVPCI